jgi:hypothetical protein
MMRLLSEKSSANMRVRRTVTRLCPFLNRVYTSVIVVKGERERGEVDPNLRTTGWLSFIVENSVNSSSQGEREGVTHRCG